MSFSILSFCIRRSNTIRNLPLFFNMQSMGTACQAVVGTHHLALVYRLIFSASSAFNASGHLGKQFMIRLPGSMSLISWFTSLNGGSLAGTPPTRSVILFIHHSLNSGSFGGSEPLPCNMAHATLPSCKPGPTRATAHSCPRSGGEWGLPHSPTRRHSSGFDGCLVWAERRGTFSSFGLGRRFLGTTEAPIRIIPGPAKSRATPIGFTMGSPRVHETLRCLTKG